MRPLPLLLAVLVLPTASAAAAPRISLSSYASRANAVCAQANAAFGRLQPPAAAEDIEAYYVAAQRIARPMVERLIAIPLPATRSSTAVAALSLMVRQSDLTDRFLSQLHNGADPGSSFAAYGKKIDPLDRRANAAWRSLGARTCAS
jgi:hypothetical protein